MRIVFNLSVLLTGGVTIWAIWTVQRYTSHFDPASTNLMWSNGNPALFFVLLPMPFIVYFLFAMIFIFEALHKKYTVNRRRLLVGYTSLLLVLVSYSVYRILDFHRVAQPYFDYDIGYLNPYSNQLFFNGWTLVAALCLSAMMSFYLASNKKGARR